MKKIPEDVIQDWVKNKKRISDRVNRINKRLKKYNKQLAHFELRLKVIRQYEKETHNSNKLSSQGVSNGSVRQDSEVSGNEDSKVSS